RNSVSAANGTLPPMTRLSAAFDAACTGISAPATKAKIQSSTVVLIEWNPVGVCAPRRTRLRRRARLYLGWNWQHLRGPLFVAGLHASEFVGVLHFQLRLLAGIDREVEEVLAHRVAQILPLPDSGRAARARAPEQRALLRDAIPAQRGQQGLAIERI